jgi:TRAP-type C4-dicarboxylate transport system permease large subunit
MKIILISALFALVVWNVGAAAVYMTRDDSRSTRAVDALTRRIGLSLLLVLLVVIGIATGLIQPHGVGR